MEQIKPEEEVLQDNAEQNAESNDSAPESADNEESSQVKERSLNEKLEELGLNRKDYFALKGEKSLESSDQKEKTPEVSNSADVEELIFANAGITSAEAREAAKKLVRLGDAANLMEATKDEYVMNKQATAQADETRQEATPAPSRRVPSQNKDSVDAWINKPGLPDNQELRFKVVEARRKQRSGSSMFGSERNITIQ